jgi:hypothetical protein
MAILRCDFSIYSRRDDLQKYSTIETRSRAAKKAAA